MYNLIIELYKYYCEKEKILTNENIIEIFNMIISKMELEEYIKKIQFEEFISGAQATYDEQLKTFSFSNDNYQDYKDYHKSHAYFTDVSIIEYINIKILAVIFHETWHAYQNKCKDDLTFSTNKKKSVYDELTRLNSDRKNHLDILGFSETTIQKIPIHLKWVLPPIYYSTIPCERSAAEFEFNSIMKILNAFNNRKLEEYITNCYNVRMLAAYNNELSIKKDTSISRIYPFYWLLRRSALINYAEELHWFNKDENNTADNVKNIFSQEEIITIGLPVTEGIHEQLLLKYKKSDIFLEKL